MYAKEYFPGVPPGTIRETRKGRALAAVFRPGDGVIYRKQKLSVRPGPNAQDIHPAPNGDTYSYGVPKFYRVMTVQPDQTIVVRTRQGRQHTLATTDPALRRANWWERLFYARRFPPSR
jgi:hypothetical protein